MKFKTTKKAVMNGYNNIIYTGYGNLQWLLKCTTETAYTTRAEGWAADIYDFGNTAIVTGYAPFGNVRVDYELTQKYEERAREMTKGIYDYQTKKSILDVLIHDFIEEVLIK